MRLSFQIGIKLAGMLLAGAAGATGADATPPGPQGSAFVSAPFGAAEPVARESLDGYRGGFVTDTGLAVSLGIERIVTINGNVADSSRIELGDLGGLTSGRTVLSADAANQMRLIQNGGGTFNVEFGQNALGATVIQNSLNNQLINNATIINASVNARGMLQAMNFQSSLANALTTAATGR